MSDNRQMLDTAMGWLSSGEEMYMSLDTSDFDAVIPYYFREEPTLVLKFSNEYAHPVELDEWGIKSVLSFGEDGFQPVEVPWAAVYAVWSGSQVMLNIKKAEEAAANAGVGATV